MIVVKSGQKLIHKLKNGEGVLYEIVEDPLNPVRRIKTISKLETDKLINQ
jgi:hypothetical protein